MGLHRGGIGCTFQGQFPVKESGEDGFAGIVSMKSFPADGYAVYDMSGDIWAMCLDWS